MLLLTIVYYDNVECHLMSE